jgi:AcrR family transcriptional regulator
MDRKETITTTARKHFLRYGYSKTTMEEIARDCEITKPTLYNYFAGKSELFRTVIDSEQSAFYNLLEGSVKDLTSPSEKFYVYAEMQIQSLKKFILLGELTRQAFLDFHPDVVKVHNQFRAKEEEYLEHWLADGIRRQEFVSTDTRFAARVFYVTIAALKFDALVIRDNQSRDIIGDDKHITLLSKELRRFVDLFLNGIRRRESNI